MDAEGLRVACCAVAVETCEGPWGLCPGSGLGVATCGVWQARCGGYASHHGGMMGLAGDTLGTTPAAPRRPGKHGAGNYTWAAWGEGVETPKQETRCGVDYQRV